MNEPTATKGAASADDIAAGVLEEVSRLANELHPTLERPTAPTLQTNLDRELGFDSLARAELLVRLERRFSTAVNEALVFEASTPADLLRALCEVATTAARVAPAIGANGSLASVVGAASRAEDDDASVVIPKAAKTMTEVLRHHAAIVPTRPCVSLWHDDRSTTPLDYHSLDLGARKIGAGLIKRGLAKGERVAIMLPTSEDFFLSFFGVIYAGGVPVPVYPPMRRAQLEEHLRRQAGILGNAGAAILVTSNEIRRLANLLTGLCESLRDVCDAEQLRQGGVMPEPVPLDENDIALIQYTSGSTGDPKGVVVRHRNLLANIRAMGEALGRGPGRRIRELAAAVSRHGSDWGLAWDALPWGAERDHVSAAVPRRSDALVARDQHPSSDADCSTQFRLRTLPSAGGRALANWH